MVKLLTKATPAQLERVMGIASEAFSNDMLFLEFGAHDERQPLVEAYMRAYAMYCYRSRILYANDDLSGFVALQDAYAQKTLPAIRLMRELRRTIPADKLQRFEAFSAEVDNREDARMHHGYLEMLMLCVDGSRRGQGLGRELMEFSKQVARERRLPLVIDTDMPGNAKMYQHMGAQIINVTNASNGVTRYNLMWRG